jgi:hypothetical protein
LKAKKLEALTVNQFLPFFAKLFPGEMDTDAEQGRQIPMEMKSSFLNWLSAETGLKDYEITDRLGQTFERLFSEIESEYGRVAPEELDPRFVHMFLLSPKKK